MKCYTKPIADLRDLYKNGQIELEPPYQRKPAWKTKQRRLLLSSLFNGIPIPALIFNKRFNKNKTKNVYDVLDGKQRLETIYHFIDLKSIPGEDELEVEFINPKTSKKDYLYFDDFCSKKIDKEYEGLLEKFWSYEIPVIEYEGDLIDIFDRNVAAKEVFVRINSTGSPLKRHEIRHALHSNIFFQLGTELEKKSKKLFLDNWRIISNTDIERYLFHEFILELCTACYYKDFSDRRKGLDNLLSQHTWTKKEIDRVRKGFNKVIFWMKDIFSENETFKATRFRNKSEFYSLFVVLHKLAEKGYVTSDQKANKIAGKFLIKFSKAVNRLDQKLDIKKMHQLKFNELEKKLYPYITSSRYSTDSRKNREVRDTHIMSILQDGFFLKMKDSKRLFDKTVKEILWLDMIEKTDKPKCPNPMKNKNCMKVLTYDKAQVDHSHPWSKGGLTKLDNAQLVCSNCNITKGAKC